MLVKECFIDYQKHVSEAAISKATSYLPKVRRFVRGKFALEIEKLMNDETIINYVLSVKNSPEHKRVAIRDFFMFLVEHDYIEDRKFPVTKDQAVALHDENSYIARRGKTEILDKTFDLRVLFWDKFYYHLNNTTVAKTCKAVIGMCLATGFDTGHLFVGEDILKVSDVSIINESTVIVSHNLELKEYLINDDIAKYIIDYAQARGGDDDDAFFIRIWKGREYDIDESLGRKKPSDVQNLVYYMLDYICTRSKQPKIGISDLRANMVYQSLVKTEGASLVEIVSTFGYVTFVEIAFLKYIEDFELQEDSLPAFFRLASSDNVKIEETDEAGAKKYSQSFLSRYRDRGLVRELKELYEYRCQVCGTRLNIVDNIYYVEVHHIIPLSQGGDDDKSNMIVVCPNHHELFDQFALAIDPDAPNRLISLSGSLMEIKLRHYINRASARYGVKMQSEVVCR